MPNLGFPELIIIFAVWVVIPILVGLVCSSIYRSKNRPPNSGFYLGAVLTFFFSVLGAAVAVLIAIAARPGSADTAMTAPYTPQPARGRASSPRDGSCGACGAQLPEGAKFCGECGTAVLAPAVAGQRCRSCGSDLLEGAKFCGGCGTPVLT